MGRIAARVVRGLGRWAGAGLWVALLAPALALLPAAVLDRGPGGVVRATGFPLALAALDPFLWECTRNSLAAALAIASGSLVLGTALARVSVRRRFWGRSPLYALAIAPLAFPPLFVAIGLRRLTTPWIDGPWGWSAGGRWPSPGVVAGWIGWVWTGLAVGVPMVAIATATALARVDPSWEDAARLAGAGPRAIWRKMVWPIARPASARAAGLVFALALVEPGAPLALGLRRTLAYQIVEAALGPDPAPRAAVLALAASAIAIAGRVLARWWGGPPQPVVAVGAPLGPPCRASAARGPRAAWYVASLSAFAALAWVPIFALLATAMGVGGGRGGSGVRRLLDAESGRLLANSFALGLIAAAAALALARIFDAWEGRRRPRAVSPSPLPPLAGWFELFPPLVLGVGALVFPEVLRLAADWARAGGTRPGLALARGATFLAGVLDPDRSPGVALILALSAVRLPSLARAVEQARGRSRPVLVDAASTLGATPGRAARVASGPRLGVAPAALLWTFALAATALAPALVLAPTIEARPLAPGILILADTPGAALPRAATLALIATALNLAALAAAAADRRDRLGTWFRG